MTTYELVKEIKKWKTERKSAPVSPEEVKQRFPDYKDVEGLIWAYGVCTPLKDPNFYGEH